MQSKLDRTTNIFIATHKKFSLPPNIDDIYMPVQVGIGESIDESYLRENLLDNIAEKNKNYCELTLLYFIWKNVKSKVVGLVHYRRYFVIKKRLKFFLFFPYYKSRKEILNKKDVNKLLNKYDLIIPVIYTINKNEYKNNFDHYSKEHEENDWVQVRRILEESYPDYLSTFDEVGRMNSFYCYNMFITRKNIIDKYCKWLFSILFELEKRIDISLYSDYQKRIFGFISERLFTVWILKNNLNFIECEVIKLDG